MRKIKGAEAGRKGKPRSVRVVVSGIGNSEYHGHGHVEKMRHDSSHDSSYGVGKYRL